MKRSTFSLMFLIFAGCHEGRDAKGPAERAGASVDDAASKTGKALKKAAVKTDEVAHDAVTATGNALEKAGKKLQGSPRATSEAGPDEARSPATSE